MFELKQENKIDINFLFDKFGRKIDYLRLSVTDACNLRCNYCMPNGIINKTSKTEILTWEEILRVINIFAELGIKKLRLTGGEPFVRKDFMKFLPEICSIKKLNGVYITTNGVGISELVPQIKEAGIKGINLSIDAIEPSIYKYITGKDEFHSVYNSLLKLIEYDIPVKINAVISEGINENQIIHIAKLAKVFPIEVRFIEQMSFSGSKIEVPVVLNAELIERKLKLEFGKSMAFHSLSPTAVLYTIEGFIGKIGIIAAHSRTFCATCNRIRITSKGKLKNCLYGDEVLDIKALMRNGLSNFEIKKEIKDAVNLKYLDGFESFKNKNNLYYETMSLIGG